MSNNNWNSSLYDQKHAFVYEYGRGLIPVLDPQQGYRKVYSVGQITFSGKVL